MTTPGRRPLQFHHLDEILPDVERLRQGHTTVGSWSLAQICQHLAIVMQRVLDLPESTPRNPSQELGEEVKQTVLRTGQIPEHLPTIPAVLPSEAIDEATAVEQLRQAIARFQASPGPVAPHRLFGPLTSDEWNQVQRTHCAHHLSFAIPQ